MLRRAAVGLAGVATGLAATFVVLRTLAAVARVSNEPIHSSLLSDFYPQRKLPALFFEQRFGYGPVGRGTILALGGVGLIVGIIAGAVLAQRAVAHGDHRVGQAVQGLQQELGLHLGLGHVEGQAPAVRDQRGHHDPHQRTFRRLRRHPRQAGTVVLRR